MLGLHLIARCLGSRLHYFARSMLFVLRGPREFLPFVSDISPKCIDREGLGRRRTGTGPTSFPGSLSYPSLSLPLSPSLALQGRVGKNPGNEVWARQNRVMSVCRSRSSYSDALEEALAAAMISCFSDVIQKIEKTLNNTLTTKQQLTNNDFPFCNTKNHPDLRFFSSESLADYTNHFF